MPRSKTHTPPETLSSTTVPQPSDELQPALPAPSRTHTEISTERILDRNNHRELVAAKVEQIRQSIAQHGQLQPVALHRIQDVMDEPSWEPIFGFHRIAACRAAGLSVVANLYEGLTDEQIADMRLVENIDRSDLNPIDEAQAYRKAVDDGRSVEQIGRRIGRSVSHILRRLDLLRLCKRRFPETPAEKHAVELHRYGEKLIDQISLAARKADCTSASCAELVQLVFTNSYGDAHAWLNLSFNGKNVLPPRELAKLLRDPDAVIGFSDELPEILAGAVSIEYWQPQYRSYNQTVENVPLPKLAVEFIDCLEAFCVRHGLAVPTRPNEPASAPTAGVGDWKAQRLDELSEPAIPAVTLTKLADKGIETVGDLANRDAKSGQWALKSIKGIGKAARDKIADALEAFWLRQGAATTAETFESGKCRFCGCTEDRACRVQVSGGNMVPCSWVDIAKTVCSNPDCLNQWHPDWPTMLAGSKDKAKAAIDQCNRVEVLKVLLLSAKGDWRRSAIVKRISTLEKGSR